MDHNINIPHLLRRSTGAQARVVSKLSEQHTVEESLIRASVGVLGDLASTLGKPLKDMVKQEPYKSGVSLLMREAIKSDDAQTKQVAQWAQSLLR